VLEALRLEALIKDEIRQKGAMSVARYMELCLTHPVYGYYRKNDPLGKDFTTSPEISQIFGEMIGVWIVLKWREMGSPTPLNLIELGPGRGTLMKDILRVLMKFNIQTHIHLVEINEILRRKQREALKTFNVTWAEDLSGIEAQNAILIANEFCDCLPISQFVGEEERKISLEGEDLRFTLEGDIRETCPHLTSLLAKLPARHALFIDYGGFGGFGDTLQAMKDGKLVSPLKACGQADLTAHVDFQALQKEAERQGFTTKLATQRDFLLAHGFEARFNALKDPTAFRLIENASPKAMGVLFKTLEISR
jgi:NADH dehydrogenase [ubiquinone] 1 alpha subcomplex assembly factor 7